MKKLFITTAIILTLSGTAFAGEFVKPLRDKARTPDMLPKWNRVITEQPIREDAGQPTLETLKLAFDSVKGYYREDDENYQPFYKPKDKHFDYWATPDEMKAKGSGDCEDFAISWYYAARSMGFKADDLNLWVGTLGDQAHVILAVNVQGVEMILDPFDMSITPAEAYKEKNFIKIYRINETGWDSK